MTLSKKIASTMFGIRKIILVPTCHPLFFTLVSFKMYLTFLQRCSAFFFLFILLSWIALCPILDEKGLGQSINQVKTRVLKEYVQTDNCLP